MSEPVSKVDIGTVEHIAISKIYIDDEFNCRGKFAPIDVQDLMTSIVKHGLMTPVVVCPYVKDNYRYKLVAGFRRTTAMLMLAESKGIEDPTIFANIRTDLADSPQKQALLNLVENKTRKNLNPVQEAYALKRLFLLGMSPGQMAKDLGVSPTWVDTRRIILEQPIDIQDEIAKGYISQEQIRKIGKLENLEERHEFIKQIKKAKVSGERTRTIQPKKKAEEFKQKKQRSVGDLVEMADMLYDCLGPCIVTRLLAWVNGNINYVEFMADLVMEYGREKILIPVEIASDVNVELGIRANRGAA